MTDESEAYPQEAAEVTVTVLIPVTEDSDRSHIDKAVSEALNGAGLTWWVNKLGHYIEGKMNAEYTYDRPDAFRRPGQRRRR